MDALELERITKLNPREIRRSDASRAHTAPAARPALPCPRCGGHAESRSTGNRARLLHSLLRVYADAGELTHVTAADTLGALLGSVFRG